MEARIDTHPPADSLKAFGLGLLDDASAHALSLHLEACPPCRRRAEEASGDDFLARLQKARAVNSTPAPAGQLPPLPGVARPAGHASSLPPDPARSFGPSLFGGPSPADAPGGRPAGADLPPELAASTQYEVIRELGRGGMGVVYLARNKQMDRLEVLKVVNRTLLERPGTAERFLREIRSAAALEHRNVVRAYACLQAGKLLALVMEYVEGEDLARLVERRGPLSVASACSSAVQAARGLQEAHDKGMVHRDIKPQNLLLSRKLKEVMILDFGLAKVASEKGVEQGLTAEGKMLGTPGYVAPEQIRDAATADIRADIYSLGCTLYFLLAGRPPFEAPNLYALLHAHQMEEARPLNEERPNVPPALAAVVARMMAKGPARRYQRPAEVAAVLAPFIKGANPAAPAPPASPKPARPEPKVAASVPPPLPAQIRVEPAPPPAVGRAPVDLGHLPAPAVSRKRKKNRGALIAVAMALLVPLAVGIAMAVLRVETPNGTLIVEMDGDVEARIKNGKLILTGPDGKDRYILTAADRNMKRDAGEYKIRVEGADGLVLDTPEFTIRKGKEAKVRVTIEAKPLPKEAMKAGGFLALGGGYVSLFDGKDLSRWVAVNGGVADWDVREGYVEVTPGRPEIRTKEAVGLDFDLHAEFWLPLMADKKGQGRANSGIFLHGRHEIQILDSYMNDTFPNGRVGAMYGILPPDPEAMKKAVRKPATWNAFDITFRSPRIDGKGAVTEPGRITVVLNGVTLIDNEKFDKITAGSTDDKIGTAGPIRLQNHGDRVRFRNIAIKELPKAPKLPPSPIGRSRRIGTASYS